MFPEFGFNVHTPLGKQRKLNLLKPVCRQWAEIVDQGLKVDPEDFPYRYGERPLVSLLASAAWRCRSFLALQEFSTDKAAAITGKKEDDDNQAGRADLYLAKKANKKKNRGKWSMEAKRRYLRPGTRKETVERHLREAARDAYRIEHGGVRVGVCFYPVWFRDGIDVDEMYMRKSIKGRLDCLKGLSDALTWYFPENQFSEPYSFDDGDWFAPGIITAFRLPRPADKDYVYEPISVKRQ